MEKKYKKSLTIVLLLFLFFSFSFKVVQAEEELDTTKTTEEEVVDVEEEKTKEKVEVEKPIKTLSEQREIDSPYSLGTLLLAILIPSVLIIIAYLIFKFVKF